MENDADFNRKRKASFDGKMQKMQNSLEQEKERADSLERELNEQKDKEAEGARAEKDNEGSLSSSSPSPSRRRSPQRITFSASSHGAYDPAKLQEFRAAMDWEDDYAAMKNGWSLVHCVCNGASPGGPQLPDGQRADGVEILAGLLKSFKDLPPQVVGPLVSGPTQGLPKPIGWTPLRFLVNNKGQNDEHRHKMVQMLIDVRANIES